MNRRFWSKVSAPSPHECWPWVASFKSGGYGSFRVGMKTDRSHRVAWQLARGPIPAGMVVCHRCDNPSCCNPSHLFLGTQADNVHYTESKRRGKHPRGEGVGTTKLSDHDVVAMRCLRMLGRVRQRDLSVMFGCSMGQVSNILSGNHRRMVWP